MISKRSRSRAMTWLALVAVAGFITACGAQQKGGESPSAPPSAPAAAQPSSPGGDTVVAKIGDETITEADLDKAASTEIKRIETQIYEAKRRALDSLIDEKLLDKAAKDANTDPDKLIATEVDSKIEQPTDADAKKFYDENKARLRGDYDALKDRIKQFLGQRKRQERLQAFMKELKDKNKVVVYLTAPKMDIELGNAPVRGNPDAKVTIVEFSDFQCPFCRRSQDTIKQVEQKYSGKVKVVFKDFPLSFHERAMPAAEAARCAGDQGKYWEFHDKLFSGGLTDEDFKKYAKELGLDTKAFDSCLSANKFRTEIAADMSQGQALGVSGTPAFFINGRFLSGAQPLDAFSSIIDEELNAPPSS
jgi:protein-disulfide isomerase